MSSARLTASSRRRQGFQALGASTGISNASGGHPEASQLGPSSADPSGVPVSGQALAALESALVGRLQYAVRTGFSSFGGNRDLYAALGYNREPSFPDFWDRYHRGGIARRIVDWLPRAVWTPKIAVYDTRDLKSQSPFEKDVATIVRRLIPALLKADILAGLGQYAVLMISAPGDVASPLDRSAKGISQLGPYRPAHEWNAKIAGIVGERNPDAARYDPRFGRPIQYNISLGVGATNNQIGDSPLRASLGTRTVHWSRVIHITHNALDNEVYGVSDLLFSWNLLDDLYKTVGGLSEAAFKKAAINALFDLDPNVKITQPEIARFENEIQEMVNGMRGYAQTRGVKPYTITNSVDNFGGNVSAIIDQLAGTNRIPQRILLGAEVGQLSSEQDRNNVNDRISEAIALEKEPLLRSIIDHHIEYGFLREPEGGVYTCEWPREDRLTDEQKASVVLKLAQANNFQALAGLPPILDSAQILDRYYSAADVVMTAPDGASPATESEGGGIV